MLVHRRTAAGPEFLLAHPGGPYWRRRDDGAWTIPKGEPGPGEDLHQAARREFAEETGLPLPSALDTPLTPRRQAGGKWVFCWLAEADLDLAGFRSNLFPVEWPPGSGEVRSFPELDRITYFPPDAALRKLLAGQRPILQEALTRIAGGV